MGYYTRVLSKRVDAPTFQSLQSALSRGHHNAVLSCEDEGAIEWTNLLLSTSDETPIAVIERSPVTQGSLGQEEIEEFLEEIATCEPASAAKWLEEYLAGVKQIYAFQHLSGANADAGFEALQCVRNHVFGRGDAIVQADYEGFTNEDGYTILWQFSEDVEGPWWMAVLEDGKWVTFEMELGDLPHRVAFQAGRVPEGVRLRKA